MLCREESSDASFAFLVRSKDPSPKRHRKDLLSLPSPKNLSKGLLSANVWKFHRQGTERNMHMSCRDNLQRLSRFPRGAALFSVGGSFCTCI